MNTFVRREHYADRATTPCGVRVHNDWRLKQYDITTDGAPIPEDSYAKGDIFALASLPHPAQTPDRPGVGLIIRHAGRAAHYFVLAWWDNQNELITRISVRDLASGEHWREGAADYSFCVWDMRVLWHERNAYVRHILRPSAGPAIDAYLVDFAEARGQP